MRQYLIIFFLIVVCRVFGSESINEANYFSPSVAYGDASGVVAGHVNVITGDFIDYGCDLVVPGPNPITLERNYASGVFKQSGGSLHSWHLNYESYALVSEDKIKKDTRICKVELSSPYGAYNLFLNSIPKKKTLFTAKIADCSYSQGFTNTSSGVVSGQTHLKNTAFEFTKKSKNLYVINGEGVRYTYARQKNQDQHIRALFRLDGLVYPNGNKIFYQDYKTYKTKENKWKLPTLIKSVNADETKVFGEIHCRYNNQKGKKLSYYYETDKGRNASYTFWVYKGIERKVPSGYGGSTMPETSNDKQCLVWVTSSHHPTVHYEWEEAGKDPNGYKKERFRINAKTEPNHRRTEILYDSKNHVIALKSPVGEDHRPVTTHQLEYKYDNNKNPVETKVYDSENHLTTYHLSNDHRLSAICHYSGKDNHKLYTKECFTWGVKGSPDCGSLLRHWLESADSRVLKSQSYLYDSNGNAIEERVEGDLTGQGNFSEVWTVYRTYSQDGKNLLISETIGDKRTEFTYYPNNNLVQSKKVKVNGTMLLREFFSYDSDGVLIQTISDDGTGQNVDDLNGVTHRTVTLITPTTSPVIGLPGIVEERYLDIKTGQEVFLGKKINSYNVDGKLIKQEKIDANGKTATVSTWEYDPHGNLLQETDALGQTTTRLYDENDNLIEEQGPRSDYKKKYVYDYSNRLIAEYLLTGEKELAKRYGYNHLSQKIWETDIHGNRTHFSYDDLGRMCEVHNPDGSVRSMEYDPLDNLTVVTDENGHTTKKSYNSRNQLVKEILPDGSITRYCYDLKGRLIKQIAANGTITHKHFDHFDRLIKEECVSKDDVLLCTHTWKYNSLRLLEETDPNGVTIFYEYDGAGRVICETKGEIQTRYGYDALGRRVRKIACIDTHTSRITHFVYDSLDRLVEERTEDRDGLLFSKIAYQYDADGNRTHVIKEGQAGVATTTTQYDALGREICVTDPLGNTTITLYHDTHPFKKETINPNGIRTLEIHDVRGNLTTLLKKDLFDSVIQKTEYERDLVGNIVRRIEHVIAFGKTNKKIVTYREYDPCNRETVCIEAFGSPEQKETRTIYNEVGLKHSFTKPDGVMIHYVYDGLERQIRRHSSDGTLDEYYFYDSNGNLLCSKDCISGIMTKREYDANNRMVAETLGNGLTMNYRYDPLDRVTEVTLPDKSKICYGYDAGYLKQVNRCAPGGTLLYSHAYDEYDRSHRLCQDTLIGSAGSVRYHYDLCSRPIAAHAKNWNYAVPSDGYDPAGNLIKWRLCDPQEEVVYAYRYDPLDQLIEEEGTYPYSYTCDSLSNRVQKDTITYTLNPLNQVRAQNGTYYNYDHNGNRTSKQSAQETIKYRYDALNRLVQVDDGSETVTYTYDTFNRRLTRTIGDHHQRFFYLNNEEIGACNAKGSIEELKVLGRHQAVAIEIDSKAYAVITDHFGNTAQLIDPCTGNPIANYRYSAFGEETLSSDLIIPWRYHQKREDPLTQLIYFGYRDYDSEIGGWSTPDPLGFADGPNLYAYVHHNPVAFHDPDGTTAYQYHDQYRPQRSWRHQFWNNSKQIVNSFSRGFIDDTSWGTSEYLLGEHQSTNWTQKVGYGAGTVASLGAGLLYGSTEAKIAAYGYKGLKLTGKQLLNHGSKLCTRNFKRITVMNSTGTVAKATKHAEKYFIKKDTTCKLLGVDKLSCAPKGRMKICEKNINHIFRDAKGHFPKSTTANHKLITDVASDPKNYAGKDKFGNVWHTQIQPNGRQIWTSSRGGEIRNAGINKKPRIFNFNHE